MRFGKLALVLTVGLALAGWASAQRPGGGFRVVDFIGQNKQLQDELKMDKDQVDKLTAALTKVRDDFRDDRRKLFDPNVSEDDKAAIRKKMSEANDKAVADVLKADQIKRLHQIENQQSSLDVFAKDDVKKALKITDDQKEAIDEINKELQKDMRDLRGFDPDTNKKRQALRKDAMDRAEKVLSDSQKTALKDLMGAPFELTFAGPGPGGPGGGFPKPGEVLSSGTQDRLKLTDEQKKQLEELQKEVDAKLGKILTDDQKKQLKDMQTNPGRPGGRGAGGNPNQ